MTKRKPLFAPASKKQELMLKRATDTQILVIGGAAGSGKSTILNHLPLLFIDDPNTNCVLYRRTNPQLEGGLWPNGRDIYEPLARNVREQKKEIIMPNGAKIKYQQAENTARAKHDAQGQEVTFYGLDEATQFDWEFTEYLFSRLRSKSKHFSRIVMSCNPDPDHKLREVIDWYIGDDGFVIPERDGVQRFFVMEGGNFVWGDSKEELGEKLNIPKERWEGKILSFAFVSGTIYDNPIMMEINPAYLAFLEGLNDVDKAQLLHGNWDARPQGANYWLSEWVKEISSTEMPDDVVGCRAYDLASTERSQAYKHPDPTACGKIYKDKNGYYYIAGDYHPKFYDDLYEVHGQFCKRSGDRDNHILMQADLDGEDCTIVLPVDPGASGKTAFEAMAARFTSEGYRVKADPTPINKSKLTRFQPFASACENGLVYVLVDTFDRKTLAFIYKQLEAFNGERSTAQRKDEFPDLYASGFNFLSKAKVYTPFILPEINSPTKLSQFRQQR